MLAFSLKKTTVDLASMSRKQAWAGSSPKLPNVNGKSSSGSPGRRRRKRGNQGNDSGWNSRIEATTKIPRYNALADRYNPYTHTEKFAKHYARTSKLEVRERRARINKRRRLLSASELEKHSSIA